MRKQIDLIVDKYKKEYEGISWIRYDEMEKEEIWINDHRDEMPVLRYTLKKDGKSYYLVEVEQINY